VDEQLTNKVIQIWENAKTNSPLTQKSAVCVSTIDSAGFPQSRFVDLKEVDQRGFTFCTSYNSAKGSELSQNPKVALLAWWDHIGCQIRVVGKAVTISNELADKFWFSRSKKARVATTFFRQSEIWDSSVSMENQYSATLAASPESIVRPSSWGGYTVVPNSIEILKFRDSRVHIREQYVRDNGSPWKMQLLQP
tara:strand:- start:1680 stop:2261 length:582 start_codon:yes stop_codon:yes gene_type:complete